MNLFQTFTRKAPNIVFFSIVLGGVAGASYALLIPILLNSIAPVPSGLETTAAETQRFLSVEVSDIRFATLFLSVCLLILIAQTFSQVMLSRVSMDVTTDLRIKLYHRISNAPIRLLEKIGPSRLIASLTADVQRIVMGGRLLPDVMINSVTLIAMLFFLFILNSEVFWFVLQAIIFGIISYQIPMFFGRRAFAQSRQRLDGLHESIRGLIYGAKELKLNKQKREEFYRQLLLADEYDVLHCDKRGYTIVSVAQNYGNLLNFFVIGIVAFILVNYHAIGRQELAGVIMALLYVIGPIAVLLNFIPQIAIARVSMRRVEALLGEMHEESATDEIQPVDPWRKVQFTGIEFEYPNKDSSHKFRLGPIDLTLEKGKVTFIAGGNGSGKSTLSKLITLHYTPDKGEIRFDGIAVDGSNVNSYRQEISAIYSDFHLFDRILTSDPKENLAQAKRYLQELDLDKKVSIENGKFSTVLLSDGQRKRLALLVAFLEDKKLYLFDEWAADQDPVFKNVFYHEILPKLREKDKCVVVISHDDRYFDAADHLVVLTEGRIESESRQVERQLDQSTAPVSEDDRTNDHDGHHARKGIGVEGEAS